MSLRARQRKVSMIPKEGGSKRATNHDMTQKENGYHEATWVAGRSQQGRSSASLVDKMPPSNMHRPRPHRTRRRNPCRCCFSASGTQLPSSTPDSTSSAFVINSDVSVPISKTWRSPTLISTPPRLLHTWLTPLLHLLLTFAALFTSQHDCSRSHIYRNIALATQSVFIVVTFLKLIQIVQFSSGCGRWS